MKREKNSAFGERVREAFNYIQNKDIALKLGVTNPSVSAYMAGKLPTIDTLTKISKLTGYSIHWLITGEGEKLVKLLQSKLKTLLFYGHVGGVGTSTAVSYIALILANIGYRVLVIDNWTLPNTIKFTFDRMSKDDLFNLSRRQNLLAKKNSYFQTDTPNLEIFIKKGFTYNQRLKDVIKPFEKTNSQIKEDYDFILCDAIAYENPFRSSDMPFNEFLNETKVIVPYEPRRSGIDDLRIIMKYIDAEKDLGYEAEFFGLFICKEFSSQKRRNVYKQAVEEVKHFAEDKMFETVIRHDVNFGEINFNKFEEAVKNTRLLADYTKLTEEILQRLDSKTR
ncbi:MAG: helix-turn-helix domain-containing protein [Acidobacteriota bacterium]|nr:helix-turn-helix domain-containing protein [Acidobacteriota bacterium]